MLLELAPGWAAELDHGPDWLFVKLHVVEPADADGLVLADEVYRLLKQHFVHRLVLEMDEVTLLRSYLLGELVRLHKRISSRGGIMRICGLSDSNYEVLQTSRLSDRFPRYHDRVEAVLGVRPRQPR